MNKTEAELDMMVADLDYENRLLRARNERLELEKAAIRNQVLDEVADKFDRMTALGDTAASFAAYTRNLKCPPCHGDCNQGRDCPARSASKQPANAPRPSFAERGPVCETGHENKSLGKHPAKDSIWIEGVGCR